MPKAKKGQTRNKEFISRSDMDPEQLARSVGRAKKNARHKALALGVDRMLTCTYKENQTDRDLAYAHFEKFTKLFRKHFGYSLEYVAVTERQERGAIHFHLALNQFYDVRILRALWREAIGGEGNIDITKPSKGGKWSKVGIVRYISKYMSKDMEEQAISKKRFSSSRGIRKPAKTTMFIPLGDDTFRVLLALIRQKTGADARHWFEVPNPVADILWFSTY